MNKSVTFGSTINATPTRVFESLNDIENARGKAVKINSDGLAEICESESDPFMGLIIYQGRQDVKAGEEISVQIKDIGLGIAGGEISVGDYVTISSEGKLVKATGSFAVGQAMGNAVENQAFYVQITKSGVPS